MEVLYNRNCVQHVIYRVYTNYAANKQIVHNLRRIIVKKYQKMSK